MGTIVTAVYEHGVVHPLHPLDREEHRTVRLRVLLEPPDAAERMIQALVQAGQITPPPAILRSPPSSEEDRLESTEILGRTRGTALSAVIIEELGEWC